VYVCSYNILKKVVEKFVGPAFTNGVEKVAEGQSLDVLIKIF
jgi:hypothetical protein